MLSQEQEQAEAAIIQRITKPTPDLSVRDLSLIVTQAQIREREDAEVMFSALNKICVHLAKKHGFKIRPVN